MQDEQIAASPSGRPRALSDIRRELGRFEREPELRENVRQHYSHLETLTESLKSVGLDDDMIDHHVLEIFAQYKEAVLDNIERLELARNAAARNGDQ